MQQAIFILSPVLFLFFQLHLLGQVESKTVYKTGSGVVKFVSDAPLELISASSHALEGAVDLTNNTFAFRVDTRTLKGFNSPLQQEHFYENYMESEKYPYATFTGKIIEQLNSDIPGPVTIRAKGNLTIHGVSQERIIKSEVRMTPTALHVQSEFLVPLSDHNITIPKMVYQKIAEEIKVTIHAELNQ